MNPARGYFNQKLYYAAIQLRALHQALKADSEPEAILLEAFGQAVQGHLQDAYGWFLLELADVGELPMRPPVGVEQLQCEYPREAPVRGELVELQQLEQQADSWLSELLGASHHGVGLPGREPPAGQAILASSQRVPWSLVAMEHWYRELGHLGERMGDSLDEW